MGKILMPLPARDFDPTEAAVPWKTLTALGHEITFATPDGQCAQADQIMLDGIGLDPWGRIPGLRRARLLGLILRANGDGRRAYRELAASREFRDPLRWNDAHAGDYDALLLPGGHRARGMREYLESPVLQALTADFFAEDKPVGAICHGVVLAARSRDASGQSVLRGRRVTALTWKQESTADGMARFGRWWDAAYYRTYQEAPGEPMGHMSVEQEVTRAVGSEGSFVDVPATDPDASRKMLGIFRDSANDSRPAWVVSDGNLVSARWPGDAHLFAKTLHRMLSPS